MLSSRQRALRALPLALALVAAACADSHGPLAPVAGSAPTSLRVDRKSPPPAPSDSAPAGDGTSTSQSGYQLASGKSGK